MLERSMHSGMAELSRKQYLLEIQDFSSALTASYARSVLFLNNFNGTETLGLFSGFSVVLPKSNTICTEEQWF